MTRFLKRVLDLCIAVPGLVLTAPLLLFVAIAIRLEDGSPALFRQVRPGYKARPFRMMKFRTMNEARGADGELLSDAERLTRVGRVIRRFSLDELPQLWNVARGQMSLVGPRPLLMEYLDHYTPEQARRHDVPPGITGWAQVNGRQDIPFSRRLELDVWYVDHLSLTLDFKILMLTLLRVVGRSGVRPGQDVLEVDDLGLNSATRKARNTAK